MILNNLKDIHFYLTLFFIYFAFFNISYFSIFCLLLFLFADFDKLMKYKEIFFLTTIVFYSLRFLFSLSSRFDNMWEFISLNNYSSVERFWDLQLNLISMKCIFGNVDKYSLKFSSTSYKSCPYSAQYGPLSTKVPYIGDIWVGTIIFSFFAISSLLLIYYRVYKSRPTDIFLLTFILMAPSMNFLIERMNIDIFILIFSLISLYYYEKYPQFTTIFLLILSLYKIHPIGILFGLLFYSHVQKNKKNFNLIFNSIIVFFVCYILDAIFITNSVLDTEWRPAGLDITFGILSDSIILNNLISVQTYLIYVVLLIVPILFTFFTDIGSSLFNYSIEKEDLKYFFAFSSLFLVNILYANYDYRIPLFLPLVIILSKYVKGKFQYIFMFLMPLSIPIFESLDFVNDLIMYTGRLSFYFFYFIILRYYKNYLFNSIDFSYLQSSESNI